MSRINSAKDISKEKATYLIYGQQGSGKTSSIKYLPGKTLVIDIDKSSKVLAGENDIDILQIDTSNIWDDWMNVVREILKNKIDVSGYDNIVVDNVTELFRSSLEDLGKNGKESQQGVPAMSDYQKVDFMLLRSLRGLNSLNKRIVFTAWEVSDLWTHESGQSFNRSMPEIRKSINNNFMGLCDVIAKITSKENKDGEVIKGFVLQPSESVMAKNRLDSRKGCLQKELFNIGIPATPVSKGADKPDKTETDKP